MRFAIFIFILFSLTVYTAFKFLEFFPQRRILAAALAAAVVAFVVTWQFLYRGRPELLQEPWFRGYVGIGSGVLGLWATFLLFSLVVDGVSLLLTVLKTAGLQALDVNPARRDLVAKISASVAGVSGVLTVLGYREVLAGPKIKEVAVSMPHLPESLGGLKIAQISDLHVGPNIGHEYVQKVVEMVASLNPDLIAVTGDLADGSPEVLSLQLEPLSRLRARYGTFYVTGNHEYYWDAESWIAKTEQLGFIPLLNENRILDIEGAKVLIGGVTDTSSSGFISSHVSDPNRAAMTSEVCDLKILLAHRPDSCFAAVSAGFHLQLSGHTHAGQFFPWNLLVAMAHKYYQGLRRHEDLWVYVNAGTGYWGPPHRFAVPSEVTLLTLQN